MHFGHKHVETGPNCYYELATFLKYHMPLTIFKIFESVNVYNFAKIIIRRI